MTIYSIQYDGANFVLNDEEVNVTELYDTLDININRALYTYQKIRFLWKESAEPKDAISALIDISGMDAKLTRCTLPNGDYLNIFYTNKQDHEDADWNHNHCNEVSDWIKNSPSMILYVKLIGKQEIGYLGND